MKEIIVKLDYPGKCWAASFYQDNEADPEIMRLFGTETLPLPFTLQADERVVLTDVRRRNPGAVVSRG